MERLGDLFDFKNGRAFKKTEWSEAGLPIIRIQNLNDPSAPFNYYEGEFDCSIEVNPGDLLFSWSGTVGSSFGPHLWTRDRAVLNQHIFKLNFKTEMLSEYAFYALKYITTEVESSVVGAVGLVHVTKKSLTEFKIPSPTIPEQKRIVAVLDRAFTDIDRVRALTEQNLKNARELFDSTLQQVFSQRGEGWELKSVDEFADTCLGKMLDKKKNKGDFKPYLRNLNVRWFGVDLDDLLEMRFEDSESERYSVKKGDLLICEGGYPGRCAIWWHDEEIYFQKALHRVRSESAVYNLWLMYFLYLSDRNGNLKESFTGAGIQHFTGKALKKLIVPLPTGKMAREFTEMFDELLYEIQKLEASCRKKVVALEELKKSLLQKAFSGQLTAKDAA